ncbi:P-loop NTPase [Jiella sp. M17.18]|uniref:nucleotide-binding protein n=1 Tax=Jiella sp. M17.18 TaxID=3234247 RepID=UPI0034DE63C9
MPLQNIKNREGLVRPPRRLRVTIASGKGGVGKSGMTINVAAAAAASGHSVAVFDADSDQHSCVEWARAGGTIEVVKIEPARIRSAVDDHSDRDVIVIDTSGAVLAEHAAAIDCADLVLVPLSTSTRDFAPAIRTFRKAEARQRLARYVLSLIDPSATMNRQLPGKARLRSLMPASVKDVYLEHVFLQSVITRRVPLRDAMDAGGTAFSCNLAARSRVEFQDLFEEIMMLTATRGEVG